MSDRHTPGPWRINNTGSIGNLIEGYSGKKLFDGDDGYRTIAIYQSCESTGLRNEELWNAKANARLIAAAPELLEALKLIANAENSALDLAYCKGIARAAIAKATGGAA